MRKVASGGVFVTAMLAERVVQQPIGRSPASDLGVLSYRKPDILRRIVAGEHRVDIAQAPLRRTWVARSGEGTNQC